jgi:Fic family protein
VLESRVSFSQEQVYLRFARNATSINHLLAHFSDIVARMLQDLAKERSGERKKNDRRCYAKLCEKADSLKALVSVASYLRNSKFYLINDNAGRFRSVPVFIRGANMTPPPASRVSSLMNEWVAWIEGEGKAYAPVLRAAIAHHGFEAVHPFTDGNGRVGRLLLNLMLMREGYPPALLMRDWRIRYIQALDTANTGNYTPLSNLIGQAVEEGLDLYLAACAALPDESYQPLSALAKETGYSVDYLGWLVRQGRIAAVKRGRRWYSTAEAIRQYQAEVEAGSVPRGRPKDVR